eukprot:TRINITY_DN81154_c0_g1_i1.p1 TRINITY_DN81154_c0_g1~~TRINITY_DN81154_c0_g1_i1.p1  ORF type:complete len:421 (-),score=106.05 TRINITY_DN81154_c0_g1_i1:276-1436(-)
MARLLLASAALLLHIALGANDDVRFAETTTTTTTTILYYNDLVKTLPQLSGKCVAITGTTSGIGYWTAAATVQKAPACLVMLNRPSSRSAKAQEEIAAMAPAGTNVTTVDCDLQSLASVRAAAEQVNKLTGKYGGLDVLALNAGIMTQPDNRTGDGFPLEMQTNHLSHFLLTKLLMPSLKAAAAAGREVRIATQSSMSRGTSFATEGGGHLQEKFYLKSPAQSLGGDGSDAMRERYHQSKLANIVFSMALHNKFAANQATYKNFKAVSAAPGFSLTSLNLPAIVKTKWLEKALALSAPDGACSLLTVLYLPSVNSGDFYEPEHLYNGPPLKVISQGKPLAPHFPRWLVGIKDSQACTADEQVMMWSASETGLGEKFPIEGQEEMIV